ncbi:hypothetical protein FGO68_gene14858 [Halteria grandinella]|uniref:non-specific serine/threonine protein kinase n=1 Tax=Halteria grandinella TaxID=5974 RepID=A0A8J8T5H2_HALGN|nr:hypothetical protein FGO68_gene14858 [Halteria grandinella]
MVEPAAQIVNGYKIMRLLGKGAFGKAFLVENKASKERYAMKILNDLEEDSQDITELEFLRIANHPFIIGYIEDFAFPQDFTGRHCIVLEHADGCDLRKKMQALNFEIPEKVALNWFAQVSLGLAKMHYKGLAHRDVKPDNILIAGENAGGIAKLGDFGTVRSIGMDSHLTYKVGTALYFAPEKITKKYQGGVDVWALGIVLYELLSGGDFPFDYKFEGKTLDEYMAALPTLKLKQMPAHMSIACQALIKKLLQKNPEKRPTIFEVLQTPIIAEKIRLITDEYVLGVDIAKRIKQQLVDLNINLAPPIISQIEEKKELPALPHSQPSTAPSSIPSQQSISSSSSHSSSIQNEIQKLSLKQSNLFSQQMLDKLIDTFNKPFNKYTPKLNDKGQSKMAECILDIHGWKWSLQQLNQLATREAQWGVFEGAYRRGRQDLEQGVYYGEMLNGNRHGYGIVYTTTALVDAYLYECQWVKGTPIEGRYIYIWSGDNTWTKSEGTLNQEYRLHGQGSWHDEEGYSYQGGWKEGRWHGQGKEIYRDGSSYEGGWQDSKYHGQGRDTDKHGGYHEGKWKEGKAIGVHRYYDKQGHLLKIYDEDKRKEITEEEYQKMQQ